MDLRSALRGKIPKKDLLLLRASFDVVGDIAILEIPDELESKSKIIANTLLKLVKNINVVMAKVGIRYGKYRRQRLKVIAGEDRFTTVHKESGCVFHLDVRHCYFSPRLSNERLRITSLVKDESVLVVGSGIGVYPIVIAKHKNPKNIVGIEHNNIAHGYSLKNITVNKVDVQAIQGDIFKTALPVFDRIIIPAPHDGLSLLVPSLKFAKKKHCLAHVYGFASDFELFANDVVSVCKGHGFSAKVWDVVKCGQNKPRTYRVCADVVIKKKY